MINRSMLVTLFIFGMMFSFVTRAVAQGIEIDCGDELVIRDGIDIQFPNITASDTHTITVIGIEDYDAVMAVFNQQQSGGCNDNSFNASGYTLNLPTTAGLVPENQWNAQYTFQNRDFMRVVVGDYEDFDGEFVLMVEGLTYDGTPDIVNVGVTADMIFSGLPVTAYVMEQTEGLDLSLALVDDNGIALRDNVSEPVECDDAGDVDSCWGEHVGLMESTVNISGTTEISATDLSPMLSIPLTADDEGSFIPFQIEKSPKAPQDITGEYVLLLHIGAGELFLADGNATATTDDMGTILRCDDEIVLTDAIDITFPRIDSEYMLSVIGENPPTMAVMDRLGGGLCYSFATGAEPMAMDLPLIDPIELSLTAVKTQVFTETAQILTGLIDDAVGRYLFIVEGLSIPTDGTPDIVSVKVTEGMVDSGEPMTVYMIADSLDLNPQLALVSSEGDILTDANDELILCFDTSLPDACYGDYEDMATASVQLGTDREIQALSRDVMLRIPLTPDLIGSTLNIMSSAFDETYGTYTLMIHLPIGANVDDAP